MNHPNYMSKSGAGHGSVEISLEPEFKGISSLLADITKYRIINEKDGLAAMKISRALFQAFLKYRLTESKARELSNEEEATLKRVLSYLIEVEEGRIPQLNLSDRSKKASKSIQTDPEKNIDRSRFSNEGYDHRDMRRGYEASVNLDAPKDDYFMGSKSRHRARSRSPSPMSHGKRPGSPSWRMPEERSEYWGKMRREDLPPKPDDAYARQRDRERYSDYRRQSPAPRDLEPHNFGERTRAPGEHRSGMAGGPKVDDVKSVKILHGCKITRLVRISGGDDGLPSRGRGGAIDYMSELVDHEERHPGGDSFSMRVKTVPTLSQAKNVAATKLGLYTDMAKSASFRK